LAEDFASNTPSTVASEPTASAGTQTGPGSTSQDDTFCVHPWMHLRLQAAGDGQVCCRYKTNITKDGSPLTLRTHAFDEIWNADEMRHIRREMVHGRKVAGCAECYAEELNAAVSMRTRDNAAWQNGWLNEALVSISELKSRAIASDFRLPAPANFEVDVGSLCNLKCRMCHDGVSSRIATDVVHRSWTSDQYSDKPFHDPDVVVRVPFVKRWSLSKEVESVIMGAPGQVKRLYFIGGEPLLVKEVGDLLRRLIDAGVSQTINIAVVSNGTVTGRWLDLVQHFKALELSISIDGYGKHYDYIRYPGKWENLVANLAAFRTIPNVSLGAAVTLQLYNALNICELFRYLDSIDLGFYAWPVHIPRYLSIAAMPPAARQLASDRLRAYADGDCRPVHQLMVRGLADHVKPSSDGFDPQLLRDFMLFTNDLDRSRRQSLAETSHELLALIAESGFEWTAETLHAPPQVLPVDHA
jgi:MoaA/NifB/PqqE/SkfB family radical SAM enzyme